MTGGGMAPELQLLPLFEGIDGERLAALAALAEERSCEAHETLFRAGDPCDGLYLLESGAVVLRKSAVGEAIERVRQVGAGELFGELETLDGGRRLFEARTVKPSRVFRLPPEVLWSFLRAYPVVETRLRTQIIYLRTERMHALLAPVDRRGRRIRIARTILAGFGAERPSTVRLEDLSYGGACLSAAPVDFYPGRGADLLFATTDGVELLRIRGRVGWRMGDVLGLVFEVETAAPAHQRRVDRAVRRLLEVPQ
jgi:CRP-like cAMP-binding protein